MTLSANALAFWDLDTDSGDRSGNGNNGTDVGSVSYNGTSATYTSTNKSTLTGIAVGTTFTISAWANFTGIISSYHGMLVNSPGTFGFYLVATGTNIGKPDFYDGGDRTGTTTVGIGALTHLVVVSTAGDLAYYVNGVAAGTFAAGNPSGGTLQVIGNDNLGEVLNGTLQSLGLFSDAKDVTWITSVYNAGTPLKWLAMTEIAIGAGTCSGTATVSGVGAELAVATGTCGGTSTASGVTKSAIAGTGTCGGVSTVSGVPHAVLKVSSSDGMGLSGSAAASYAQFASLTLPWKIRQAVTVSLSLNWVIGDRPQSFYRVTGKCKPATCPPVNPLGCSADSRISFVVNIYARNVTEVCQKLVARNMVFPIATIEKFSTPPNITNSSCNTLIDVTPPLTFLPCQEMLIDSAPTVPVGFGMTIVSQGIGFETISYIGSGSLRFQGTADRIKDLSYSPSGSGVLSGEATCLLRSFGQQASGRLGLSGTAFVALGQYFHSGSGSLLCSGVAQWFSSAITVSGTGRLLLSANSAINTDSGGGGTSSFSGSAGVTWGAVYLPLGSLGFSGGALVSSSDKRGGGGASFTGSALASCSSQGNRIQNIGVRCFVSSQSSEFAFGSTATSPAPLFNSVNAACCPLPLPERLRVSHPLATTNYFNRFLLRNNFTINTPLDIFYSPGDDAWYGTTHYRGFAPDSSSIEQWVLTFGFQCINGSDTLSSASLYWKFTFMASLRNLTDTSLPLKVTRLVAGFDTSIVCFGNRPLLFIFDLDTQGVDTTPGAVQQLTLVDEIGMFRSRAFLLDPVVQFKISEQAVDITQAVVDIGPTVVAAMHAGDSISGLKPVGIPIGL